MMFWSFITYITAGEIVYHIYDGTSSACIGTYAKVTFSREEPGTAG